MDPVCSKTVLLEETFEVPFTRLNQQEVNSLLRTQGCCLGDQSCTAPSKGERNPGFIRQKY